MAAPPMSRLIRCMTLSSCSPAGADWLPAMTVAKEVPFTHARKKDWGTREREEYAPRCKRIVRTLRLIELLMGQGGEADGAPLHHLEHEPLQLGDLRLGGQPLAR